MTVAELRDLRAVVIFLPKSAKTIFLVCVYSFPVKICLNFSRSCTDIQLNITPQVTLHHVVFNFLT